MTLEFRRVRFGYRRRRPVFADFDFRFPDGATVLLGPNGAGKTTLLSLGAALLHPQSGEINVGELSSTSRRSRTAIRSRVMLMPQQIRPVPGLTAREQVAYAGWLKGLDKASAWSRSLDALDAVSLGAEADSEASSLSGGQLRRVGVAQAVVHDADLVLMDEPTAGLDPVQRGRFRELLGRVRSRAQLVVSTHQTEDISDSYDSVVVLVQGTVIYANDVSSFLSLAPPDTALSRRAEVAYASVLEAHGFEHL